jgi:CysZ protein
MRNIARQMTAAEIDEAVHYYTGRPALIGQDAARQGRYLYRYARPLPKPSAVATSRESFSPEDETKMLDAAVKALSQILSPPMRSILWRSIGLALVLIVVLAIGLQRLLSWFATSGEGWLEAMLGPGFHTPLEVLSWIVSIAAGLGVVFGAVFLMPAITSLVASVFVDEVADHVEAEHYPAERPGVALPFGLAMTEGVKTALLTILVYLIALPFFFAGVGFIAFFIATAWLLSREYFELAAMRFRSPAEAKAMRKDNAAVVFTAGLIIAAFVSIPIVNLATPLFGMAFMVHMHKRLSGPRPELIEPARRTSVPTI